MTTPSEVLDASLDAPRRCMGRWVSGSGGHIMWSHDCPAPVEWVDIDDGDAFCDQHLPRVDGEIHPTFRGHVRRIQNVSPDAPGVDLEELTRLESSIREIEERYGVAETTNTTWVPTGTARKLLALARRALAQEAADDVHRRRAEMCERFLREHWEIIRDCCGSFAYEPGKRTGALEAMRAVYRLAGEFGVR